MIGLLSALAFFHYTFAACPSGFIEAGYTYHQRNNFCYKLIVNSGLSFNDSEALCQFDGAHLASIHDDEENIFLNSFAYGINAWIGLYNNNGTWTWTDGTALGFSKFICGTPSPSLNCTSMYNTHSNADCSGNTCDVYGQWTNNDCNNLGNVPAAICKKPHY
uniref:C-type lectin domain-containing protein n=1 Tax=Acrobeloides nanus TaxID=290746 RepID=A0A914DYL7_9BILA